MSGNKYILDKDGNPVVEPDLLKWGKWFEEAGDNRRIAYDEVGDYYVSTVFLGLDYSFGGDKPVLFETMVFEKNRSVDSAGEKKVKYNKNVDEYSDRYFTKEDALFGHKFILDQLKDKLPTP